VGASFPVLSPNGRFVLFLSSHVDLVPADQGGCILNADGDCDDDVLQVFDPGAPLSPLRSSGTSVVPCGFEACDPSLPYRVSASSVRFLTRETDEGRDLNGDGDATDLLVQIFSVRDNLVKVIAQVVEPPASQQGESTSIDPVEPPPLDTPDRDSQVLLTQGVCVESLATSCTTSADCAAGAFCEAADSTCKREGAPCRAGIPADCAPVETCMPGFVVASSPDGDGDGIVDAVDNCPASFNSGQIDTDRDGLGEDEPNATGCDDAVCGNSIVETGEACDDGNLANTDGCNQFCRLGGCFGDVDLDGNIDSNDAGLFFSVSGCFVCANGCNPVCDSNRDGLVNASDALALHLSLGTSCPAPASSGGCGLLGAELVPILAWLAARRRRR
jgi:cysteine-rich repeat protein